MILRWRRVLELGVSLLLLLGLAFLLSRELKDLDMASVIAATRALRPAQLYTAAALTLAAYAALATYEIMAMWHTRHAIPKTRTALASFVSYAFNFNLGALVGAIAMRLRLYGQWGLRRGEITSIVIFCVVTGWIGYSLVAGVLFATSPPLVPERFRIPQEWLRPLGGLGLALAALYLALCAAWRQPLRLGAWGLRLPLARVALLQLLIGATYWLLATAVIYSLFPAGAGVPYERILGVYLIAAMAGVATHIPAGLGVLEGTFVLLLTPDVPAAVVVASMLSFRLVYYLIPMLLAASVYAWFELRRPLAEPPGTAPPHALKEASSEPTI